MIDEKGGAVQLSQTDDVVGDMDWTSKEILDFVKKFKFFHSGAGKEVSLDLINPHYRDMFANLVREMALVLGKELSESIKFKL